jgi:DNA-binding CsgD family transcriptional regulator
MNQHVDPNFLVQPKAATARHFGQSKQDGFELDSIRPVLRLLAARTQMHHGALHWLSNAPIHNSSSLIAATWRCSMSHRLKSSDLCPPSVLAELHCHGEAIAWERDWTTATNSNASFMAERKHGISIAFHDGYGTHLALTFADKARPKAVNLDGVAALCRPFLVSLAATHRVALQQKCVLSQREIDCLQWAAAGKTSYETAIIMRLSGHTVNQHLANAAGKLGAVSRTHAVAKAMRMGLLDLSAM